MSKHRGKRKRKPWKGSMDRHHLTAKYHFRKNGQPIDQSEENVAIWKVERHRAYHAIFFTASLEEAIAGLIKKGQLIKDRSPEHWEELFGRRTPDEAITLLLRFHRMKRRCTKALTGMCILEVRYDHRRQRSTQPAPIMPPQMWRVPRERDSLVPA